MRAYYAHTSSLLVVQHLCNMIILGTKVAVQDNPVDTECFQQCSRDSSKELFFVKIFRSYKLFAATGAHSATFQHFPKR